MLIASWCGLQCILCEAAELGITDEEEYESATRSPTPRTETETETTRRAINSAARGGDASDSRGEGGEQRGPLTHCKGQHLSNSMRTPDDSVSTSLSLSLSRDLFTEHRPTPAHSPLLQDKRSTPSPLLPQSSSGEPAGRRLAAAAASAAGSRTLFVYA